MRHFARVSSGRRATWCCFYHLCRPRARTVELQTYFYRRVNAHPTPQPLQHLQGTPVQQSTPSSVRCDASIDSAAETSQASAGSHTSQVHEWVPRRASGRDSFQIVVIPDVNSGKPLVESSEAVPLSGPVSLEGAQELWAVMGPTTAFWLDPPEQLDSSADVLWENSTARTGEEILSDENEIDVAERKRWQEWAKHAAEHERQRRMKVRVMGLASKRARRFATRKGPRWKGRTFLRYRSITQRRAVHLCRPQTT